MSKILVPLPDTDFDTTEVSCPWDMLSSAGHEVVFATEEGGRPACDPLLLKGVVFGQLGAKPVNLRRYERMQEDPSFTAPLTWRDLDPGDFDALLLPGGHAPGMKQYLESMALQSFVRAFWETEKPVAAICHGVIVLARTTAGSGSDSVIKGFKVTALTKPMEGSAYLLSFWKLGRYYRTYPEYVEDEVARAVGDGQFLRGPLIASYGNGFVVEDRQLITGRWPGDAEKLAAALMLRLTGS